ncbi:MAG TPA: hypothetical protein VNE39_04505 [Planctomycetota bacterium]|nr:hypothetical protein [Planctomycetota bacterium]
MKIEDLAHRIAGEALTLLEKKYHYRIAEDHKKDIQNSIRKNLNQLLKEASETPPAE